MKKIVILGAGIVGLAIARQISIKSKDKIILIEKEKDIALHQSSRNSGVMHAGLYYKPGSLKARLSREGINLMKDYCTKNKINWIECGKIVIGSASSNDRLMSLYKRGKQNGLKDICILNKKEIHKIEPYVKAESGIYVPEESIVNYKEVAKSYRNEVESNGGEIIFNSKVIKILKDKSNNLELILSNHETLNADIVISSTGLYGDKVAKLLDIDIQDQKILPFRGEYYFLKNEYKYLVKNLVYPTPDPKFPFLGVHFTRMIDGSVEAGPNAVLAFGREAYNWKEFNLTEFYESIRYAGLQKFIYKYPLITLGEFARSFSKKIFANSLSKLIPDIREDMLTKGNAGIRAQLMNNQGELIQDFDIRVNGKIVSILNAPSPAATSSLAIAKYVVEFLEL